MSERVNTVAVVVAAGGGYRLGRGDKAFVELGGIPLLCYSLAAFQKCDFVSSVVVAVPPRLLDYCREDLAKQWPCDKVATWTPGGATRGESVMNALAAVPESADVIAVHDAARPFPSAALLDRLYTAVRKTGAAVPGIAVTDTIVERGENGDILRLLARERLRAVQTPQFFSAALIRRAYRKSEMNGLDATDDSGLVVMLGARVAVVEGDRENRKITWPADLERAGWELERKRE